MSLNNLCYCCYCVFFFDVLLSLSLSRYCGCGGLVRSCSCLGVIGVQGNAFVMVRWYGLRMNVVAVMGWKA